MVESVLQRRIKELVKHHGSIRKLGRVLEVDHAYLYRLSTGEKDDPGPELLRKLKLRRVVTYERTEASVEKPWPFTGCSGSITVTDQDEHDAQDVPGVSAPQDQTKPHHTPMSERTKE